MSSGIEQILTQFVRIQIPRVLEDARLGVAVAASHVDILLALHDYGADGVHPVHRHELVAVLLQRSLVPPLDLALKKMILCNRVEVHLLLFGRAGSRA